MNASSGRGAPSQQSSPPRRSELPSSHQSLPSNSVEATSAQQPPSSRRRRVLGRLVRSSAFNAEAPEFVPQSLPKPPSKRKGSSFLKAGKAFQADFSMDTTTTSATDPPLIRAEDVLLPGHAATKPKSSTPLPVTSESSDEEFEELDLTFPPPMALNRRPSNRFAAEMGGRIRVAVEAKKRQENTQASAAILIFPEWCSSDWTAPVPGIERLRYLPLCHARAGPAWSANNSAKLLTVLSSHSDFEHRSQGADAQSNAIWPAGELPVELFDLITSHLARDDVKTMRLVNREFEQKVSRSLFHTSVVPFNTEIYDMIDEDRKTSGRAPQPRAMGKTRARSISQSLADPFGGPEAGGLQWQNAKDDKEGKVYRGHGLRVFRGFGPHIKRFGMSFEISEQQLAYPPTKKELDHVESYFGSYDWPSMNYARFATLAGLENTADETSRMKAAFENLEIVQELALSIDSGLGWLNGPDKSLRSCVFDQTSPVFGSSFPVSDRSAEASKKFWAALEQSQASFDPRGNLKEMALDYRAMLDQPNEIRGLRDNIYSNTQLWSSIAANKIVSALPHIPAQFGTVYATGSQPANPEQTAQKHSLMPGDLSKEQREWLLETQWAQQAFLESYMLAVIDNPSTFSNVTALNFAKVSSRFLPMLARESFWEGLPHLSDVILKVSPDWRTVEKDDAGFAQTSSKFPSEALRVFHRDILQMRVAPRKSIKKLTIGWVGGGEHAQGLFARHSNVLPAPITRVEHCTANSTIFGLVFDHVEHLTLINCWITPPALAGLINSHSSKALKKLTLDSVSLTAHPRFPNAHGAGAQFAQAMAAMQAQHLPPHQQAGAAAQPGFHGQQPPLNAHQMAIMQHQINQMHQINAANQNAHGNNHNNPPPTNAHWTADHREGSWPYIIDLISPGTIFRDYLPAPAPWDEPYPERPGTTLRTIEFKSCGYVKLPNHTGFDQIAIDPAFQNRHTQSPWFRNRFLQLKSSMMTTTDRNLGHIVQYMPWRELNALQLAWGLTEGWQDAAKAEEPEFDGYLPGGTGRFSGVIGRGMALVGPPSTSARPA